MEKVKEEMKDLKEQFVDMFNPIGYSIVFTPDFKINILHRANFIIDSKSFKSELDMFKFMESFISMKDFRGSKFRWYLKPDWMREDSWWAREQKIESDREIIRNKIRANQKR